MRIRRVPSLALGLLALACVARGQTRPPRTGPIGIGDARGAAGEKVRGALPVGEAADGTTVALPLAIVTGRKPGPVVWVDAGAHGDEYGGPRALQEVVRSLDPETMSGAVVAVFSANPPALRGLQRVNPNLDDLADMGDVFPGRARFATERIASVLSENVGRVADYFIDLHTGGDRFRQHPFVFYTTVGAVPAARIDALARGFGVATLWRDTARVFPNDAVTAFAAAGIPAFLLEVGGGQPLDPKDIRFQADAVTSFLRAVGVLPGEAARTAAHRLVTGYKIVTNSRGGFFEAAVAAGDRVSEGSVLGRIFGIQGDLVETLTAPAGADIVLGVSTYPATPTGGWLFEVGTGFAEASAGN